MAGSDVTDAEMNDGAATAAWTALQAFAEAAGYPGHPHGPDLRSPRQFDELARQLLGGLAQRAGELAADIDAGIATGVRAFRNERTYTAFNEGGIAPATRPPALPAGPSSLTDAGQPVSPTDRGVFTAYEHPDAGTVIAVHPQLSAAAQTALVTYTQFFAEVSNPADLADPEEFERAVGDLVADIGHLAVELDHLSIGSPDIASGAGQTPALPAAVQATLRAIAPVRSTGTESAATQPHPEVGTESNAPVAGSGIGA
ncbi:hypothetical protein ACWDUL_20260 [Nocardia niigatensis]